MNGSIPGYRKKEILWAYGLVAIPVLGFLIFGVTSMIASLGLSFTDWSLLKAPSWVGFANYADLFKDPQFYQAFYNTVYLMLGIPLHMLLALLLAMMMNRPFKGVAILRMIYYLPVISPVVAITLVWQWIYNSDYGLINGTLQTLFHVHGPHWLENPVWVKPSMIMMDLWIVGGRMILYLAGLQSIPSSYYEAATMDGANVFQKFKHITFPLLSPVHFFIVVTGIIGVFQTFSQIYLLWPDGGPQYSAATTVYYIYEDAFQYFRMGYASAGAWILMICILIITVIQFQLRKRWVFEN